MKSNKYKLLGAVAVVVCCSVVYFFVWGNKSLYHKSRKNKTATRAKMAAPDKGIKTGSFNIFICTPTAEVFADSLHKKVNEVLHAGDSVSVDDDNYGFLSDRLYEINFKKKGKLVSGYIRGRDIGPGVRISSATNNTEILAAHYLNYMPRDIDDLDDGKAEVLLIRNGKISARKSFEAYSDIRLDTINKKFGNEGLRFFSIAYGLEACDYPQAELLGYVCNDRLDTVCKDFIDFSAGNYACSVSYTFPGDSGSVPGKLLVTQHNYLYHDENDINHETGEINYVKTYSYQDKRFLKENQITITKGDTAL